MAHKSYKVSEDTRRRLLDAAGELFACHGTEAVTVRDITARAGTMPNAVSYHFGGKEGLIDAVWEFCLREWTADRMGRYCKENEHLFETRDGKRQLVTDLIDIFYETLYADEQPLWANLFLLRMLITAQNTKRMRVFNALIFDVLGGVYQRITGNDDRMTARCWVMTIISPGSYLTASATDFLHFEPASRIDRTFCRRLQGMVTQSALSLAGLADTPKG
ncbi:MAG: TetR/AcrR family transcriptional regulator [Lentisphaeria bacterium]|nr:TetR/AcrR family transcriptional regulator [Lentisphaeria bacterium]